MSIKDANSKAEAVCIRESLKFLAVLDAKDNTLYVHAISRDEYGEVWRMEFDAEDEHTLSERVLRFALDGNPDIPLCVIEDAASARDYMERRLRMREGPGLAVDPVAYGGEA